MEGELIGVQGLPMAAILSILPLTAVLAVPDEGVSGMGELGTDLMGPPVIRSHSTRDRPFFTASVLYKVTAVLAPGPGRPRT